MIIRHAVQKGQMESVLEQFEATTAAIEGIEQKTSKMQEYIIEAQDQQQQIMDRTGRATALVDKISGSLVETSNESIENCLDALDTCAGLIESLEDTMAELGPSNALKELQMELWPLLVPAVALMFIITVGNCFFGFELSRDADLAKTFAFQAVFGDEVREESGDDVNVLNIFATFHVILICIAAFFVLVEIVRTMCFGGSSWLDAEDDVPQEPAEEAEEEDASVDSMALREDLGIRDRGALAGDIPRSRRLRWDEDAAPSESEGDDQQEAEFLSLADVRLVEGSRAEAARGARIDPQCLDEPSFPSRRPERAKTGTSHHLPHSTSNVSGSGGAGAKPPPVSTFLRTVQKNAGGFVERRRDNISDMRTTSKRTVTRILSFDRIAS